jgi:hypothetical protein
MIIEKSEAALADYLVSGLSASERLELAGYLDKVLAKPDAREHLKRLWNRSQADFYMMREVDKFFAAIRQRL